MKKSMISILLVASLAFVAAPGSVLGDITTGSWTLSLSNLSGAGNFGSVSIKADDVAGTIEFKVNASNSNAVHPGQGDNFGIDKFAFNFQNLTDTAAEWTIDLPTDWSQDSSGGQMDGFGNFLVLENGTGSSRQDPLEFTITLTVASEAVVDNFVVASTGQIGDGLQRSFFAAHIAGFGEDTPGDQDDDSHFVGAPVPAPGAVVLAAMGLGLVGWVRRRFR